jgi:hypothetical protein
MTEIVLAALGLIGALGGIVLGHRLSEGSAADRELRTADERRANVRALLNLEICKNQEAVSLWWDHARALEPRERQVDPTPERLMRESQASALPGANSA